MQKTSSNKKCDGGKKTAVKGPLVSVVMPVHNGEKFIDEAIHSVLGQTYDNWELIVVDDASSDSTLEILGHFSSSRIRVIALEQNGGAAKARNRGIAAARGQFICFLDADDLWQPSKLKKQLEFAKETEAAFMFGSYVFADASGRPNGKVVRVPSTITYKQALKNATIWTSTVMFDMRTLKKGDIKMPDVRRGQDTATWRKVLKKIGRAYGLGDVVAIYRRSDGTLSANKIAAMKRTWNLYRNVEHLSFLKSLHCFSWYCFNAAKRRI